MLAQGTGGCLLFNVSKQAVNPGPNFGPYGLPKAATLFLVRQYALDYGAENGVSRTPEVRAALLRAAWIRAPRDPRTAAMAKQASADQDGALRFIGLAMLRSAA